MNFVRLCDTIYYNENTVHNRETENNMEPHDYKVTRIDGEYATLTDIRTGDELFIALFLLPEGTDIGMSLHYENLCYEITGE